MARKQNTDQSSAGRNWRATLRYGVAVASILLLAILGIWIFNRVDQFLAGDPRFQLRETSEDGVRNAGIQIEGARHASRPRILSVFAGDAGRSVYLVPLRDRRSQLLGIDWVREASVSRVWPNRLQVRISERIPVAFVQLPDSGDPRQFRVALIDAGGVILDPPERARFTLPVLTGIRREQNREMRARRVKSTMRLISEVGKLAKNISEIDVADQENLKVVQQIEGQAVILWLGNSNYLSRMQNFLNHYPEIRRRLAQATTFDLRLDDRITAMGGGTGG